MSEGRFLPATWMFALTVLLSEGEARCQAYLETHLPPKAWPRRKPPKYACQSTGCRLPAIFWGPRGRYCGTHDPCPNPEVVMR